MNDYHEEYRAQSSAFEMRRQLAEAIDAGERALNSLQAADEKLSSAKRWGVFDILGGGFIASMVKRSKMEDAAADIRRAGAALEAFQRELLDVHLSSVPDLDCDGFLSFADLFMDGFAADMVVQYKLSKVSNELKETMEQVASILQALRERYRHQA
ncbi:MAG: hypothetical protein J6K32_02005 [Clostridia bacterium]|nr:hypothetical protein [Clostridia bacterium]